MLSIHRWAKALPLYTHNLLLEIGYGKGLLGLVAFVWFLIELFRFGIRSLSQFSGQDRILVTGCLIGLVASLGWGVLDVAVVFFPFFTFPAWALIGLLITAPQVFKYNKQIGSEIVSRQTTDETQSSTTGQQQFSRLQYLWIALLSFLVLVAIISTLTGNYYYRAAYNYYQNRSWQEANDALLHAARWDPFNAKYHQLRGEVLINQGEFDEAINAYENAVRLKRDFSPYYSQLGWLYWLKGDLSTATVHFQKAVDVDPKEAWSDGLHAQLGLVYTAQSRFKESIPHFSKTIELDPQMAISFYWVPIQRTDGSFDIVIDPVYFNGPSAELKKRILTHLGKADFTSRLFNPYDGEYSPISLNHVLDVIEVEHLSELRNDSTAASRLLATIAEAAQLVGLNRRAENAYLAFQQAFPESAYGYRGLGILYQDQRRLEDAQAMFEKAVKVSPENADSWLGLTEIYIKNGMYKKASEALNTINQISPLDVRLYELKALLNLDQGNAAQAADALEHSLHIRDSIPTRLLLSDLYRQLSQPGQAVRQCLRAIEVVQSTWPRPLKPELWEIGLCLAQSDIDNPTPEITAMTNQQPLIGYILLGHFYRARGNFSEALEAYQAAVDVNPVESAPHYFLGQIYQAIGEMDLAKKEYLHAAELDPLESLSLLALAQLQFSQGQQDLSYETIQTAVEVTPGWGQTHVALGNALLASGDLDGAAYHYQLALFVDGDLREDLAYDFASHLVDAEIVSPGQDYVHNDYFNIEGDQRRVLFTHPDSLTLFSLDIPEGAVLSFDIATGPESWQKSGDGVTFAVYVRSEQGADQIFSTYIDPKNKPADQHWHPHAIDLSPYAGQTVTLIFETGAGPAGDYRYDWAGWGEPRLLRP